MELNRANDPEGCYISIATDDQKDTTGHMAVAYLAGIMGGQPMLDAYSVPIMKMENPAKFKRAVLALGEKLDDISMSDQDRNACQTALAAAKQSFSRGERTR